MVTRRRCLNGSTIPVEGPTPRMRSKLPGCMYRIIASCFVEASLTVEKAVSCYKADRLVASLPSFRSVQSSLAVRKFCAAGKERCERGHRQACAKPLMPDVMASKAQSQLCELSRSTFEFNMQEFSMVGGYTENLRKPQNCQN